MTKKVVSRLAGIPIIGKNGLMAIIGAIVGLLFHKFLTMQSKEYTWLEKQLIINTAFRVKDVINLVLPLMLLVVVRRYRAFFIGWFVGAVVMELYEWLYGYGPYEAPF